MHSRDKKGNTLCHYAVSKEDDRLLAVLLGANLPKYWFPMNDASIDILEMAVHSKARCVAYLASLINIIMMCYLIDSVSKSSWTS